MKKLIIALFFINLCSAQVAIGKQSVDGSGILDFAPDTTNGIILPNVTDVTTMTNVTPGTLVFDRNTSKIKYFDGFWKDLTDKTGTNPAQIAGVDNSEVAGVIIGNQNSTVQGVLVLDSDSKALILPLVNDPVANVKSPEAGMICYDPVKKLMCLYNGKEWFFWQ